MKKILLLIICFLLVLNINIANASTIYSYKEVIPISESITLTKVKEFRSDFSVTYSYIKADLTDSNTSLKLLKSDDGIDKLETVSNLAGTKENIVAALNADFFSSYSGNTGFSLGIEVEDEKLLTSPINPQTMATVSYIDKELSMSYLDFHIMAVAPNWQYNEIRHLNKHTDYYGDILMYTKEFNNGMSPAPGGEVLEVLVEDGIIKEFRRNMPSVEIPENGCVLVVSEGVNMFFANNFNVGDEIRFDYYITPDIQKAEVAFGGGAMLVKDGEVVTDWSHVIAGHNPRSAIGVDKSGKTLYLVAVDGRQGISSGMRMSHLGSLMKSLGCYNAVNLDGGGSTNMVASTVWNKDIHTVNSPTENRKVINAIGLTYDKPTLSASEILVKADKYVTFIGQPVKIETAVYDKNKRPVDDKVTLSSPYGEFNSNIFTPDTAGEVKITAKSGKLKESLSLFVVDKISGIETDSYMKLKKGETKEINFNVFDEDGNYVKITNFEPFNITSSDSNIITVNGNKIKALNNGNAIITISKDGAKSYISVAVGEDSKTHTDYFENLSGKVKTYPKEVSGEFELSDEFKYSYNKAGKLKFDFTLENDEAKAVYYNLDTKYKLSDSFKEISLMFYTKEPFSHELRAQFFDENNELKILSFGNKYETNKWQKLTLQIPSSYRNLTLDSIYVVYLPEDEKDKGEIYIDDLTLDVATPLTQYTPYQNIYTNAQQNISSFDKFYIGAINSKADSLLSKYINNTVYDFIGSKDKGYIIGDTFSFNTSEFENGVIINLNTSGGGIRKTDSSQWEKLADVFNKTKKQNIFIVASDSLFGTDEFENQVIEDFLSSSDKNVFVITDSDHNSIKNIKGVYYLTLGNKNSSKLNKEYLDNLSYIEFNFDGKNTSFSFNKYYK